ncbi:hypothetical protein ACLFKR_39350, partial [Paraburkholderia sp. BR14264]
MPVTPTVPPAGPLSTTADDVSAVPCRGRAGVIAAARDLILDGVFTPGERLRVRDVAEMLDVAPLLVLAAFSELRVGDLLEVHGWGVRVVPVDLDAVIHADSVLRWMIRTLTVDESRADQAVALLSDLAPGDRT